MFIIKRNGKRFGKKSFYTYDEARNYVRKVIRKQNQIVYYDFSGAAYRNPAISLYGFEVEYNANVAPWRATDHAFTLGF